MFGWLTGAMVGSGVYFSGEDVLPTEEGAVWHHEDLTRAAALALGWSAGAADDLAFHADYVDAYLYNPLWWAQGGLGRLKAVLSTRDELKDLHFDDLTSVGQIDAMWRRYTSGTVAGLFWAARAGDIGAARHVVGVGLHAIQDFYSHSTWIDDPRRRDVTWLDLSGARRRRQAVYTGTYEGSQATGIAHHGKMSLACSLLEQVPSLIMEVACHSLSPLSNSTVCQVWRDCEDAVPVKGLTVHGVTVPEGLVYLDPPGIALDARYLADLAVRARGLEDIDGAAAFECAYGLALRDSSAWLARLDAIMDEARLSDFWSRVKHQPSGTERERHAQFEDFSRFPFIFLTVGGYPPRTDDSGQWHLRVRLRTADEDGAGTDAPIWLTAGGHRRLLDYAQKLPPVFEHDDFVAGDNEVYYVGPLPELPTSLELFNDTPDLGDVFAELGRSFVAALEGVIDSIGDFLLSLVGGHANPVAFSKLVWSPSDRAAIHSDPVPFSAVLDGSDRGDYRALGSVRRVARSADTPPGHSNFEVRLDRLHCLQESEEDRLSDSDEPLLLAVLVNQAAQQVQKWRSRVESDMDVDSGESWPLGKVFRTEAVPDQAGYLTLALHLWESDDEGTGARDELLDAFAGQLDRDTKPHRHDLLELVGGMINPSWKLDEIEVTAFQRGDPVRCGTVLHEFPRRWIGPGDRATFRLQMTEQRSAHVGLDQRNPERQVPRFPPDYRWSRLEGYAYEADGRGRGGEPLVRLCRWWSPGRLDSFSTTDARYQQPARTSIDPDYRMAGNDGVRAGPRMRPEGYLVAPDQPQPEGMVPLHRWWSPSRKDNWCTTDPRYTDPVQEQVDPDYRHSRLEGWLFDPDLPQPAGTVPIHRWWSPSRTDNVTTSDDRMRPPPRSPFRVVNRVQVPGVARVEVPGGTG